ncbi:hypothetical protein EYF80_067752 [Liparis tanakae]|uniref:Uncharacterized protein n=1 Tax=Liparis tanakae TaxID=230148 RepID=A0A4Z2E041_9TELE|nr:hypothetical protein EYF80_067752 [Liparis tanakae]
MEMQKAERRRRERNRKPSYLDQRDGDRFLLKRNSSPVGGRGTFHWGTFHWGTFHWGTFHWGTFHWGTFHWGLFSAVD